MELRRVAVGTVLFAAASDVVAVPLLIGIGASKPPRRLGNDVRGDSDEQREVPGETAERRRVGRSAAAAHGEGRGEERDRRAEADRRPPPEASRALRPPRERGFDEHRGGRAAEKRDRAKQLPRRQPVSSPGDPDGERDERGRNGVGASR